MAQILFYAFILVSLIHLLAAFFLVEKIRKISKLFLMPLLLAYFIAVRGNVYLPVLFALIFAFVGDFFLLEPQKLLWFKLGLASFLLGHLCYIPAFISLTEHFHLPVLIISYVIAIALGFFMIKMMAPEKNMMIPVILYTCVILNMSIYALQLRLANLRSSVNSWSIMIFIGSLLFICSDTLLAFFTFHKMPKRGNVLIMLFYITAQSLIVIGLGNLAV
jgi:uncharacterized membrane protein YhhN